MPIGKFCEFWLTKNVQFCTEFNIFLQNQLPTIRNSNSLTKNVQIAVFNTKFHWFSMIFIDFHENVKSHNQLQLFPQNFPRPLLCTTWNYHWWLQDASFSSKSDHRIPIFARFHGVNRIYTSLAQKSTFSSASVVLLYETKVSRLYKPFKLFSWWGVLPSGS